MGELIERRIERGFENLAEPDEEEHALLLDGGRERMARLMREASAVGARAWSMPDGCGAARAARTHDADTDGAATDVAAVPLQATQGYGVSQEDDDEDAGADEAVRRAPTWHATQQYGCSQEDGEGGDDDDEAVRRPSWLDASMAESPRDLAARWAACGLEMDDELTGEPSDVEPDGGGLSALAPDDEHDVMMSDVGVEAEALVCDAECEQQREVFVERVVCVGADVGGGGSEVRRGHEGEGGVEGCEGVDGVERRAVWAAHEVEGEYGVEAMEGDENVSLQSAVGGSGSIGGIKKKRPQRRAKGAMNHRQRQLAEQHARRGSAMQGGSILPFGM